MGGVLLGRVVVGGVLLGGVLLGGVLLGRIVVGRRRPRGRTVSPVQTIRAVAVGTAVAGLVAAAADGWGRPAWWALPLLAAVVALSELAVVSLQFGRQTWTFSLTEGALGAAWVLTTGAWTVLAVVLGVLVAQTLLHRPTVKKVFNLAVFGAATAAGSLVAGSVGGSFGSVGGAVAGLAVFFAVNVSALALLLRLTLGPDSRVSSRPLSPWAACGLAALILNSSPALEVLRLGQVSALLAFLLTRALLVPERRSAPLALAAAMVLKSTFGALSLPLLGWRRFRLCILGLTAFVALALAPALLGCDLRSSYASYAEHLHQAFRPTGINNAAVHGSGMLNFDPVPEPNHQSFLQGAGGSVPRGDVRRILSLVDHLALSASRAAPPAAVECLRDAARAGLRGLGRLLRACHHDRGGALSLRGRGRCATGSQDCAVRRAAWRGE